MKDWKKAQIPVSATVRDAIRAIDGGALQIAFVVDDQQNLLGIVTDGDIRRGILSNVSLDDTVTKVLNKKPTVASEEVGREELLSIMRNKSLHQVPIIDKCGKLIGLKSIESLLDPSSIPNTAVIMAGGLGTRLRPITNDCPKPMLKVGGRPILETLLDNLTSQGFKKFYIAVNYLAEIIKEHFGDGSNLGVEISYLEEKKRMGTAGALGLLPQRLNDPILVMNGDLLTNINFQHLFSFHQENKAMATMCVREYDFQVPYGVVKVDQHRLICIEEKPIQRFFVNAGIYVLNPEVLDTIPRDNYYDMPSVFNNLVSERAETAVFPIREYWVDIGRFDEFERANNDFMENFKC